MHLLPCLAMLLTVSCQVMAVEHCPTVPAMANEHIEKYVSSERGAEYCQYRQVTTGDLNQDQIDDLAVIFTHEGSCYDDQETPPGACGNNY